MEFSHTWRFNESSLRTNGSGYCRPDGRLRDPSVSAIALIAAPRPVGGEPSKERYEFIRDYLDFKLKRMK
jgi:hypothetical protein